ncbi:hypothetical protein NEF87_003054 [Candidatus Lokiarchaeum ossiferum]|uniref:Uncharacterized protein n=1 Tax=Candidatus Lokiarchaeum ossiferum TaxID=2951803 RepID=A0ABY6HWD5_9ARCH|nr:hypothetical protein NEF87_003054 [Candidatus Lokiarchaeum sp. B-35]
MPTLGETIIKILKRLDDIEKKIDSLVDSTNISVDLSSRDSAF